MNDHPNDRAASDADEFDRACERAAEASRASIDPLNQVVYALQRAKQRLEFEAAALHEAHDYGAEFPASDAEQIGHAISFVRVLGDALMPWRHVTQAARAIETHQPFTTIAEARKHHGLTQDDVARRIGVTRGSVAQWEMGQGTRPDPANAVALSRLLPGLTLDVIYGQAA